MLATIAATLFLGGLPPACVHDSIPRSVERGVVSSPSQPAAVIRVGRDFAYLGCFSFEVEEMARGTRYLFVDAEGSRVRRMLILHFEEFQPGSQEIYRYDMSSAEDIDGYRFRQNAFAFSGAMDSAHPGSEAALTTAFLAVRGYEVPNLWLASRFVTLGSADRRSEFIVFYLEPAGGGMTLADLYHGEQETATWRELRVGLRDRSRQAFAMLPPKAVC